MTREEAIHILKNLKPTNTKSSFDAYVVGEAITIAIKALEHPERNVVAVVPCGDTISRQVVLDGIEELKKIHFDRVVVLNKVRDRVLDLPPVNPQEPKTGHWIEKDGFDGDVYYDCSECGESWTTIEGTPWDNVWNYCPSCGARMVEPQESEG